MIDTHILDLLMADEWHPDLHPFCVHCGYDLTGSVSDRCPECGMLYSRKEIVRQAYALKNQLRQLALVNDWVRVGFFIAIAGVVLVLPGVLFKLFGPAGVGVFFGRIFGVLCGLPAFFMGLSVVRVARLPAWARRKLPTQINYGMAYVAVFIGVTLVLSACFL